MTVFEIKQNIIESLASKYQRNEIDGFIRIIFEHLKGWSPIDIIMHRDYELSDFIIDRINCILARLQNNEPIQYIVGEGRFFGNTFKVTPATLIPRQETEELVELIVKENSESDLKVLDIGTGTGCIAIILSRYLKFPIVDAIDISAQAIEVAKENAANLKTKINFQVADIFSLQSSRNRYDIIVSNPPYITEKEKDEMECNVVDYEPHSALFVANDNPICFYCRIADYAIESLRKGGKLYFEINPLFADDICIMLKEKGFSNISTQEDIHHRKRFVKAEKPTRCS